MRQIADLERQTGVTLDKTGGFNSPAFAFMVNAVTNDWDTQEIKYQMLASVNAKQAGGELGKTASDVRALANDYGVPLSDQSVMDYARKIGEGAIDQNGVQGYLIEQAKSLFPASERRARQGHHGQAVRSAVPPDRSAGTRDQPVRCLLDRSEVDAGTQPGRPENRSNGSSMNLDEWLKTVRSDAGFGYDQTDKAVAGCHATRHRPPAEAWSCRMSLAFQDPPIAEP